MFFRKVAQRTAFIGWLIAALSVTSVPQANAAQTVFYSAIGLSGCDATYQSNFLQASKIIATRSSTFNTIRVLVGGSPTTNFATSRYYVMGHTASGTNGGNPSTSILATFTPDAISGSGVNTAAVYIGSFSAVSGTSYWIVPAQQASNFPQCYRSPFIFSEFVLNGFIVDTSTSGTNNAWVRKASPGSNPASASWTDSPATQLAWQFSLENNTSEPVVASLSTQSGSLRADYRTITPLTVSVDTQSRVTFYANGRVVPGCRNVLSSSGTATCNWRPAVHGSFRIYAAANPVSSSYVSSNTSTITVGVAARTNKR
jgi:hypothetical protein